MSSAENPFRYGAVARGPYFTDRGRELGTLLPDLRGGQDVVVVSPRRYGKTSLVERAIETLRAEGTLVAYLDLLGAPTKEELADDLAQAFYDGLVSPVEHALDRVRNFFSHLRIAPRITLGEDGKPQFEFLGYERGDDLNALIEGLLALPGRVAVDGRKVVVVFDEFQEIVSIDEGLPGQIRSAFQRQPAVAHVYLGSKRHLMEPLFMNRAAPLYRSAKPLQLGPIEADAFLGFLRQRFGAGGVKVDEEPLRQLLSLTGGRPYETQELCSFAWTRARLEGQVVDLELVTRALADLLDAESARYLAVYDRLAPSQRALLIALARDSGRVFAEEYRRRHNLGSASSMQKALAALDKLDLVEPLEDGGHALTDIFLRLWLLRLAPREERVQLERVRVAVGGGALRLERINTAVKP
jgi:uncharacterized protein